MSKEMDLIDVFSDIYKHKKAVALAIVLATLSSLVYIRQACNLRSWFIGKQDAKHLFY